MRVVFMGPPGAGKGTQAARIAERHSMPHIATGDIFRQAIKEGTPLGREVKKYLDAGALVPDDVTTAVVAERLSREDCAGGFVLDGFPRTLAQAEALDATLAEMGISLDVAISLVVRDEEIMRRLGGRRVCTRCGATYHIDAKPPRVEGVCDLCGAELRQRHDDREETIRERLEVYRKQTAPVLEYYRTRGKLAEVDGEQSLDEVTESIEAVLRHSG